MTYFKIFAISVCSSLLFLSIFVMVAFDSENTLSQAYDHFSKKQYYEARDLLIHKETPIPMADFYLYEAYLAREELGVKKSQNYLLQAFNELSTKKSSTAYEITLNLAFDACLQKDVDALQNAIDLSCNYAKPDDLWILFFKGYEAYLNKDYPEAIRLWEASEKRQWLSNWMKTGFENHLNSQQIELKKLHAEIETGHTCAARKRLEELTKNNPQFTDDINFLVAFSYLKECHKLPTETRSPAYQKALDLLHTVPANNTFYVQQKEPIFNSIRQQILDEISRYYFEDFAVYVSTLEKWNAKPQLEMISKDLAQMLNEKVLTGNQTETSTLIQGLYKNTPEGQFKNLFLTQLRDQIQFAISQENLRHLEKYLSEYACFFEHPSTQLSILAKLTSAKTLEFVDRDDPDFQKMKVYLRTWHSFEKNAYLRYTFAQELVQKAQHLWATHSDSKKAIELMKIAKALTPLSEQNQIQEEIQKAIVKTYRQVLLQDHVREFPFILLAIQEFNLSREEFFDERELINQLEDAEYLFYTGDYSKAYEKANWVLQVDMQNAKARRLAALASYEQGHYNEALGHFKYLNPPDASVAEALAISQLLSGETFNGLILLQTLSEKELLSRESILRIGLGFLTQSQTDQGLQWLEKIQDNSDEVLTGLYIAAFQKRNWDKTIHLYSQLPPVYKQIPAIQGIAIQAFISQNRIPEADEIFSNLMTVAQPSVFENGSKAFVLLQKHLNFFDANDFAARYLLHIKGNPQEALKKFYEIKNISPELLLERAELAYSLKQYPESIQDLQKSLQSLNGIHLEKALGLLGTLYYEIGFYLDSVKSFQDLFKIDQNPMPSLQHTYAKALMAIGRFDLAAPYFASLGMVIPNPEKSPQQSGFAMNFKLPPQKRLKLLELQMQQFPDSLTLEMLLAKELMLRSEKSTHASEELLLAFALLQEINEQYADFPEIWFLQAQVFQKLKFHEASKQSFITSIALNPNYAEAYRQLAALFASENNDSTAIHYLTQLVQMHPEDLKAWQSIAQLYEKQDELKEAIEAWTKVAKLNPEDPSSFIKIAKLNLAIHKPEEALAAIEHAFSLSPNDKVCWKIMQDALQHSGHGKISKR